MKTVKISALALAMMGVFATSANAQSAKANAWEGAYGQVSVGYGMFTPSVGTGTATSTLSPTAQASGYGPTSTVSTSAASTNNVNTATANLGLGYNFAVNSQYVVGVGISYYPGASSGATGVLATGATTVTSSKSAPAIPVAANNNAGTLSYNIKNLYSITINPGYVIDKDRLAYAKVGYTGATIGLSGAGIPYNAVNLTGYTLGLGYKQMVTESLYMLGEVNYASYGNKTATATSDSGTALNQPVKGTGLDFLVGIGYRF
jgi:opacity protein-like surface antigen